MCRRCVQIGQKRLVRPTTKWIKDGSRHRDIVSYNDDRERLRPKKIFIFSFAVGRQFVGCNVNRRTWLLFIINRLMANTIRKNPIQHHFYDATRLFGFVRDEEGRCLACGGFDFVLLTIDVTIWPSCGWGATGSLSLFLHKEEEFGTHNNSMTLHARSRHLSIRSSRRRRRPLGRDQSLAGPASFTYLPGK